LEDSKGTPKYLIGKLPFQNPEALNISSLKESSKQETKQSLFEELALRPNIVVNLSRHDFNKLTEVGSP